MTKLETIQIAMQSKPNRNFKTSRTDLSACHQQKKKINVQYQSNNSVSKASSSLHGLPDRLEAPRSWFSSAKT
jgi:hypothetical protein